MMLYRKEGISSKEDSHNNNHADIVGNCGHNNSTKNNCTGTNGYKLLSAEGMASLQGFLKQHGSESIKKFIQVGGNENFT